MLSPDIEKQILFPHQTIREGQAELIEDAFNCIKNKQVLIAHAPTGLGKTASTLAVAVAYAIENDKKVFFLTNRHTQHQIAIETLKEMRKVYGKEILCADLIGKKWMCNQEVAGLFGNEFNEYCKSIVKKGECEFYSNVYKKKELTVEARYQLVQLKQKSPLHNEELQEHCKQEKMCSYEMSISLAKKASVIIGDYYYLFNPKISGAFLQKLKVEQEDCIVIVDEGHNLPERITNMLSSQLTSNMLKNAILEAKKFNFPDLIPLLNEINTALVQLADFPRDSKGQAKLSLSAFSANNSAKTNPNAFKSKANPKEQEKLVTKDNFIQKVKVIADYDEIINQLNVAAEEIRKKQKKSYIGGVGSFLKEWQAADRATARIIAERISKVGAPYIALESICLDPSILSSEIFEELHGAILMSGTLTPTSMYKDLLGIKNALEKSYPSPFPPENKLSIVLPKTSTKYTLRGETMYQNIADECIEIAMAVPGNIALFFPSYHMRDKIAYFIEKRMQEKQGFQRKKLFWEKQDMVKEEKEELLKKFKQHAFPGGILLAVTGANFAEGVDFPGDVLKAVVVIGIPLGKPNLKTKETINYYDKKFSKGWNYAYIFPAINKCIQSAGRCIRSSKDRGVIVFLGERFAWRNYFDLLPKEGLQVNREPLEKIRQFFSQ